MEHMDHTEDKKLILVFDEESWINDADNNFPIQHIFHFRLFD